MAWIVQWLRFPFSRAAALALTATALAGCSGESSRFSDNPFSDQAVSETTGSIHSGAGPATRVESRPLPPQVAQASPAPSATAATSGVAGGGRGMASYTPISAPAHAVAAAGTPEVTGAITAPKPAPGSHWTSQGGTPVTVAAGETVEMIARRHGVPASAIIHANNLGAVATIQPGQQLVIPHYQTQTRASAPAPQAAPPAAAPVNPGVHVIAPGETLSKISRLYGKPVAALARANNIPINARLNAGDRLVIPGVRTSAAKPKGAPAVADAAPASSASQSEPAPSASVFTPVSEASATNDATKATEVTGSLPKFRWPANGRVITAFGPSTNGQQNDGINIAVPENTPVKAAEDGVVAYAGNELKGYGNLVLVRHPNGYVTAYAHTKELLVKRGDQVKRGQVIARSGQSGNVNAPQLHFEIRKGASPVDPTKFLSGA